MWARPEVMPLEIEKMGQVKGQGASEVKEAGAEKGLWVSWVSGVVLYYIFIQPVKYSLDFADSQAGP